MNLWINFVKEIYKNNPHLKWKQCLIIAKPLYFKLKRAMVLSSKGGDRRSMKLKQKANVDIMKLYAKCIGSQKKINPNTISADDITTSQIRTVHSCLTKKQSKKIKLNKQEQKVLNDLWEFYGQQSALSALFNEWNVFSEDDE